MWRAHSGTVTFSYTSRRARGSPAVESWGLLNIGSREWKPVAPIGSCQQDDIDPFGIDAASKSSRNCTGFKAFRLASNYSRRHEARTSVRQKHPHAVAKFGVPCAERSLALYLCKGNVRSEVLSTLCSAAWLRGDSILGRRRMSLLRQ